MSHTPGTSRLLHTKASWRWARMLLSPSCLSKRMLFQIAQWISIVRTCCYTSGSCRRLIANKLELLDLHIQGHTRRTVSIGVFPWNKLPLDIDLLALLHIRVDRLCLLSEGYTVEPRGRFFVLRFPCHGDRKLRDGCPIRGVTHLWVPPQIPDDRKLCHAHCCSLLRYLSFSQILSADNSPMLVAILKCSHTGPKAGMCIGD